jgi:hypothetical protein
MVSACIYCVEDGMNGAAGTAASDRLQDVCCCKGWVDCGASSRLELFLSQKGRLKRQSPARPGEPSFAIVGGETDAAGQCPADPIVAVPQARHRRGFKGLRGPGRR